jgi:hypothetical protein
MDKRIFIREIIRKKIFEEIQIMFFQLTCTIPKFLVISLNFQLYGSWPGRNFFYSYNTEKKNKKKK